MATTALNAPDRSVSVGRIFSRAFATIGNNPLATLGVALLFGAIPSIGVNYLRASNGVGAIPLQQLGLYLMVTLASGLLSVLLYMITQGSLVRATMAESEGERASFGECAATGFEFVLPLLGLGLLMGIALIFGFVLLLVPGILLYLMWAVAAPALVVERIGVIESFRRSRYLTKGARLKIFGLQLVVLLCSWLLSALLGVLGIAFFGTQPVAMALQQGASLGYWFLYAVMLTLIWALFGTVSTSLYIELREWKDGPAIETLADVFS